MRLVHLALSDFRNVEAAELEPGPRFTVLFGANGQGKTNLLEAVYLLATLRPLRASRLAELPRFGTRRARVEGRFDLASGRRSIAVEVEDGERRSYVDGRRVADPQDYFGGVCVVSFTPDDLAIVKGGPDVRRRYLDRAVFNRFPAFLAESRTYTRALRARNRLLRDQAPPAVIEAFDPPLAAAGARIVARRRAVLEELQPRFAAALASLSRGQLEGKVRYAPSWLENTGDEASVRERMTEELARRLPRDRERHFTSVGPHADNLSLILAGRPARTYASQGQQRALTLALKIGEIENLRDVLGFQPLLLLDDVSSELDRRRSEQLLGYLSSLPGQILLTTTEPAFVAPAVGEDAVFASVSAGVVERAAGGPFEAS